MMLQTVSRRSHTSRVHDAHPFEPPDRRGNSWLIGICAFNCFILYPGVKQYYRWRNRTKAAIWDAMTPEEQADYLATTKDRGNRRLDFQFAH